jgi:hypothetical protein
LSPLAPPPTVIQDDNSSSAITTSTVLLVVSVSLVVFAGTALSYCHVMKSLGYTFNWPPKVPPAVKRWLARRAASGSSPWAVRSPKVNVEIPSPHSATAAADDDDDWKPRTLVHLAQRTTVYKVQPLPDEPEENMVR